MPDKLYRSHSLEFSNDGTSGSLTLWEDSPVSPFNVGDTFRPVPQSPQLTVEKVSIKDNVIGEANGKTIRQWEVTIEGSNFVAEQQQDAQTHIKYNFNISDNEKSGTMEVVNQGDNPALSLDIGRALVRLHVSKFLVMTATMMITFILGMLHTKARIIL